MKRQNCVCFQIVLSQMIDDIFLGFLDYYMYYVSISEIFLYKILIIYIYIYTRYFI